MNDPLFFNKFAAAVLTALLMFFGLPQLADALLGGGHHGGGHGKELHLAYPIDYQVDVNPGDAPVKMDLGTLMASATMTVGERRAALCKSCHTFEEGGANGTGPNLWNIVGRQVATVPGFNYSSALKEFGGVWTYERLDGYLANSQGYVPGTAMVQRFPKDDQRADILAYLGSLSASPLPFPEPAPPADDAVEAGDDAEDAR